MPDIGHILDVVLRTFERPDVLGVIAWSTLTGVLTDFAIALVATRWSASLLGALSTRLRDWLGALANGIVHPLLIGLAATALTLAATRRAFVLEFWWVSGIALGVGFALLVLLLEPAARRPQRLCGPILLGLSIALAARLLTAR